MSSKVKKIGIYSDVHCSLTSSILTRTEGYSYSARLDSMIESFKWMYNTFKKEEVDVIIDAGDLTNSDILKSEENSALAEALSYSKGTTEIHILGNHERKTKSPLHNSIALLKNYPNTILVGEPTIYQNLALLPYNKDYDPFIFEDKLQAEVLISHADYKGMRVGRVELGTGYEMDYVSSLYDMVFNGHIHNISAYNKIVNIGQLMGDNFSDDYSNGYPGIIIYDIETKSIKRIVNPKAILFFKTSVSSITELLGFLKGLTKIKNLKCLKIEIPYSMKDDARDILDEQKDKHKILASRLQTKMAGYSSIMTKEESVNLSGFASGSDAMKKYVELQSEDSLPAPKEKMMNFISDYLI